MRGEEKIRADKYWGGNIALLMCAGVTSAILGTLGAAAFDVWWGVPAIGFFLGGVPTFFSYPFAAALSVKTMVRMRRWGYGDEVEELNRGLGVYWAAFWPIMLPTTSIVYLFHGVYRRWGG